MKLSDHTTDSAADVLITITPLVENIAKDQTLIDMIGRAIDKEGMTQAGVFLAGLERLTALVPLLLKDHRADLFGIVGAVNSKSAKEIGAQKLSDTMAQIREVSEDGELLDFLRSFLPRGKTA